MKNSKGVNNNMEHSGDVIPVVIGAFGAVPKYWNK